MKKRPGSAPAGDYPVGCRSAESGRRDPAGSRVAAVPSNLVVFRDGMVVRTVTGRDTNDRRESLLLEVARRDTRL